ncbi:hypothetical protein K491DRAFT_731046 [Lophiostoma macrostomum CBS 122681]|uniref:Myb-like domain-containing protein n=1 Tax=Lophiostoma macrostomum CBS 122681 TaxID=1314788 RepID=A0A6A6SSC7_9PLEO|nr:hypothetical protein K491DRAFT_731046 [Lophiostoma macrostomum CBS 122681]
MPADRTTTSNEWNDDLDEQLARLRCAGRTWDEVAQTLGFESTRACRTRFDRLKFEFDGYKGGLTVEISVQISEARNFVLQCTWPQLHFLGDRKVKQLLGATLYRELKDLNCPPLAIQQPLRRVRDVRQLRRILPQLQDVDFPPSAIQQPLSQQRPVPQQMQDLECPPSAKLQDKSKENKSAKSGPPNRRDPEKVDHNIRMSLRRRAQGKEILYLHSGNGTLWCANDWREPPEPLQDRGEITYSR